MYSLSNLFEEIDAESVHKTSSSIKSVLDGRRDVGFTEINKNIIDKLNNFNIGVIPVKVLHDTMTVIVYRNKEKALRLYSILKKHDGLADDKSPEEAREIGQILGYAEDSIQKYIDRRYNKKLTESITSNGLLNEDVGQMEKAYVKTGMYDEQDVDTILDITQRSPFTKLIADMYYYLANRYNKTMVEPRRLNLRDIEILQDAHDALKRYNKNVLPIHDLYAQEYNAHALEKQNDLRMRELILEKLTKFPSILLRNLRNDIRRERTHYEFDSLWHLVKQIQKSLELLERVKPDKREIILRKVFSSNFTTFEAIGKRLEDTTIPYLSQEEDPESLIEKVNEMGDEAEILLQNESVLVVMIKSADAMKYLGCSSQWCFATEMGDSWWNQYAENGFAFIIFNFNEDETEGNRMMVALDTGEVYNMYNENVEDGWGILGELGAADAMSDRMEKMGVLDTQDLYESKKETKGLNKKLLYKEGDLNVMSVNGEYVKGSNPGLGFVEFVEGGHHYPDSYPGYKKHIPENEVWVDDAFISEPTSLTAILLHEKLERYLMIHHKLPYDKSHEIANKAETEFRKKTKGGLDKPLSKKIYDEYISNYEKSHKKEINESIEKRHHIKITPEIREFVLRYSTPEHLLRHGGIPTDLLDMAAYGFTDETIKTILPSQLSIKWKEDLDNVKWQIAQKKQTNLEYAKSVDLSEPIDVSYSDGKFYIEDGHHRYYAAKILGKPLKMTLEIKDNPIKKLGGNLGYDEFHMRVWKEVHGPKKLNETFQFNRTIDLMKRVL